jgi:hypothetical protein
MIHTANVSAEAKVRTSDHLSRLQTVLEADKKNATPAKQIPVAPTADTDSSGRPVNGKVMAA